MKNLKTPLIALTAIVTLSGTAFAGHDGFKASFSYDAAAPVEQTYASITATAKDICTEETQRAGFRMTEPTSWQQRQCVKQITARAVKATKNASLIAFHKSGGESLADQNKFASRK